jgi:D-serine deaminase-like pyridoxal phosphate-dependent protein
MACACSTNGLRDPVPERHPSHALLHQAPAMTSASPITLPDSPCLLLDLDVFERNVARMVQTIVTEGGKRWRPHVKALRAPALALRLQAAGAAGVTCATVGEAEVMVEAGIHEVLIASQVVGPSAMRRLARLNREARVIVAVDAKVHLGPLEAAAREAGVVLPVVIEVEIGMQRCGILPGTQAVQLAQEIVAAHPALCFCGLMAWEGHTTAIADPAAKAEAIVAAVRLLTGTAQQCRDAGLAVEIVSCGGTGTYPITATLPGVTEIQAGGGVFGDRRYRTEFHIDLEPALTLQATVLSRPSARRVVCNAGWRYLASWPTPARALGVPGMVRLSASAEHLTLDCDRDVPGLQVGASVALEVGYADSTVFLHPAIHALRKGEVEQVLQIPRRP